LGKSQYRVYGRRRLVAMLLVLAWLLAVGVIVLALLKINDLLVAW
jgi:hypothetical protein